MKHRFVNISASVLYHYSPELHYIIKTYNFKFHSDIALIREAFCEFAIDIKMTDM